MFIEFGSVKQSEPQGTIVDHIGSEPLEDVEQVVAYLRSGHPLIDMMDIQDDVIDGTREQIMNGSSIVTDGQWLWREDLAYYVKQHNVTLPEEFLHLIRARNY